MVPEFVIVPERFETPDPELIVNAPETLKVPMLVMVVALSDALSWLAAHDQRCGGTSARQRDHVSTGNGDAGIRIRRRDRTSRPVGRRLPVPANRVDPRIARRCGRLRFG